MHPAAVDRALALGPDAAITSLTSVLEDQWFERKSGAIKAADLAVALIAFANAEGGVIAVGLHDGRVVAVSDRQANELRQAAADFTRPVVRAHISELTTQQGRVLIFRVSPSDAVHETQKGECYQRIGDESKRLSFSQRQELEWDRGYATFDGTAARGVHTDDLDPRQVQAYQAALGSRSIPDMLAARDLLTREGTLTVAGWLLFAERPQQLYPSAHVRVLQYTDVERGAGRTQTLADGRDFRCEGSIPQQIQRAREAIEEWLPRRRAMGDQGTFESVPIIPRDAWLEGLVNAVVHRSYSNSGDHVRVEIFPNRVEITSPGRFPGIVDPSRPESIGRHARNPRIARVCADLGVTQELGEGIRRIFTEMKRVGLIEPLYRQSAEAVHLTLLASNALPHDVRAELGNAAMSALDALRSAGQPLGTGQVVELMGLARPTVLRHLHRLREAGLVEWTGQSPNDPRATWRVL